MIIGGAVAFIILEITAIVCQQGSSISSRDYNITAIDPTREKYAISILVIAMTIAVCAAKYMSWNKKPLVESNEDKKTVDAARTKSESSESIEGTKTIDAKWWVEHD